MIPIFEVTSVVKQEAAMAHIKHSFQIDLAIEQLVIDFSYSPKIMNDKKRIDKAFEAYALTYPKEARPALMKDKAGTKQLTNLLTVNVEDPNGFRGNGHRQASVQRIVLSEEAATDGFYRGKIPKGLWTVSICTHSIVSEEVTYKLKISGIREGGL